MKKRISFLYELCVCLAVVCLIYLFFHSKNQLFVKGSTQDYCQLDQQHYTVKKDPHAPIGIREIYQIHPSEIPAESNALVFRTVHQNVDVYIDNSLVFRLKKAAGTPGGRSPGSRWNTALILAEHQGKEIRVEIQPVYEAVKGLTPVFYAGTRYSICMEIVRQDYLSMLLSIIAIVIGIGFMAFTTYSYHSFAFDRSLFMMGQFAMLIGIWKLADTGLFTLLTKREDLVSSLSLLALFLLSVPFTQYIREMFSRRDHWIWNGLCMFNIGIFLLSVGLQASGIADLREMLWLVHLSMLLTIFVVIPMLYAEVQTTGWSRRLKAMTVCISVCLAGLGTDIVIYYQSGGVRVTNLGMIGFLIYITVLGAVSLQDARRLIAIGMRAKQLEQMAYHDQLTGLYNRAAYAEDTKAENFTAKGCILVMFDLNNLKYCNDTFGHDKGDLYIISSAARIFQIFGSYGKCYRMGGDEFCVVLKNTTQQECEQLLLCLKQETENWNHTQQESFTAQIAAGYALFDETADFDFGDTRRRADKMMYKDKFQMKQETETGNQAVREETRAENGTSV